MSDEPFAVPDSPESVELWLREWAEGETGILRSRWQLTAAADVVKGLITEINRLKKGRFTEAELRPFWAADNWHQLVKRAEKYNRKLLGLVKPDSEEDRTELKSHYAGQTSTCCECCEEYPKGDHIIDGEVFCPLHRDKTVNNGINCGEEQIVSNDLPPDTIGDKNRERVYSETLPSTPLEHAKAVVRNLSPEDRETVFSGFEEFCTECGCNNPRCQCWNDE